MFGQSNFVSLSAFACSAVSPHQPVPELHHLKTPEQSHRFPLKSGPHRPSVGKAGRSWSGQSNFVRSSAFACSAESPHQPFAELQNTAQFACEQSHLVPLNIGPHRPSSGCRLAAGFSPPCAGASVDTH